MQTGEKLIIVARIHIPLLYLDSSI